MEYKNDFDCPRFEADIFGYGRLPNSWERRPGWLDWQDVRFYFGLGSQFTDQRELREGKMNQRLYNVLTRRLGEERMADYFPKPKSVQKSKEDMDIEELATLMAGSLNQINQMRNRRK